MLSWLSNHKDAIAVMIAIGSILVTAIVWTFNHQYNQYVRIGVLENTVITLQKSFASYHRTLLLTELVKVEQEIEVIEDLEAAGNITAANKTKLIDLLVKQQVLIKEIAEIGNTG